MAVTLAMIAAQVGVDRSLVSRVLRGDPNARLSQEKRDQILAVAKESGYRPNRVGQSLRTGRTKIIGVFTPDVTNPFHSILFRGVEAYANAAGYDTILCNTDDRGERSGKSCRCCPRAMLMAFWSRRRSRPMTPSTGWPEPTCPISSSTGADGIWSIRGSDRTTSRPAGSPPTISCRSDIAHRDADRFLNLDNVRLRVEGFQAALMKDRQGDVSCSIMQGLVSRADIRDYMSNLLMLSPPLRPTAVFTPQSRPGEGAASAIYRSGLQIPKDISIIGYTAHEDPT